MSAETIIARCFLGILILFYVTMILYLKFDWFVFWFHDVMKWHRPDASPKWSDGLSTHATCKFCGRDIMQDSQGNWF